MAIQQKMAPINLALYPMDPKQLAQIRDLGASREGLSTVKDEILAIRSLGDFQIGIARVNSSTEKVIP
jgi:hypothetical protein